jgi:hypothetical protein
MAKKAVFGTTNFRGNKAPGKTSVSKKRRSVKFSTMNKSRKRSWKAYRGQGR